MMLKVIRHKKDTGRVFAVSGTLIAFLSPALAFAHPGHGIGGFLHGLFHPLSGLDHLLTALAVGFWAADLGGKVRVMIPATFVSAMVLGGVLGFQGVALPFHEAGILLSMLFLGAALFASVKMKTGPSVLLIAAFGIAHGNAHGIEMTRGFSAALYSLGFVAATVSLHAAGIVSALLLRRYLTSSRADAVVRTFGAFTAASAGLLAVDYMRQL